MIAGVMMTGFTVLSAFTAVRVYLKGEQWRLPRWRDIWRLSCPLIEPWSMNSSTAPGPHPARAFRLLVGDDPGGAVVARIQEIFASSNEPAARATVSELSAESEAALELALWESVRDGSASELETYLEQYPEGTFASLARTRLDAAACSPRDSATADPAAAALDLAFWDSVKDSNRREGLETYLRQHPNGHFADLARTRLASPD
jgi:hypothetical protein